MKRLHFLLDICVVQSIIICSSVLGQGVGAAQGQSQTTLRNSAAHAASQTASPGMTSMKKVSGKIKAISHTISPDTAAYNDCNFTLVLSENNIDYLITAPMFTNRVLTPFALKKIGDVLSVRIIPFEAVSERVQQIQTVDDINDFEKRMYYADTIITDTGKKKLIIYQQKKELMLQKILKETKEQIYEYNTRIAIDAHKRKHEISELKKRSFTSIQKKYGYFYCGETFSKTNDYSPTLLQGLLDLNKKCKENNCELIIVPCISEYEYGEREILKTTADLPFIDYGRMKLIIDCLKNGILAIDTNAIIKSHQADDYLPFSVLGDGHFSKVTNVYIADAIATDLGIKKNAFTMRKGFFHISSMHLGHYSGPLKTLIGPIFKTPYKNSNNDNISILVVGDSFTSTNNFDLYLSSLTQCNVKTVRHNAGANLSLKKIFEGNYDSILRSASLVIFVVSAPYIETFYPTQETVELLSKINKKQVRFHMVPIRKSNRKAVIIELPNSFSNSKTLKAIVETYPVLAKYSVAINERKVFDYDCDFKYASGFNKFLLRLEPNDFKDGKIKLCINGNAVFSKIILVDDSTGVEDKN